MSKKDNGKLIRIPEDVWFALDTISKNNYRSVPQQLEKILREQPDIKHSIVKDKKKKREKPKETITDYKVTKIPNNTMNKIAIIAEKNIRTITKQVEKYLTEGLAREKGKKVSKK